MSDDFDVHKRSSNRTVNRFKGKWKLQILDAMKREPLRLGQLGAANP
jgi:DNA-binding HxlR family transcriptional regulator